MADENSSEEADKYWPKLKVKTCSFPSTFFERGSTCPDCTVLANRAQVRFRRKFRKLGGFCSHFGLKFD